MQISRLSIAPKDTSAEGEYRGAATLWLRWKEDRRLVSESEATPQVLPRDRDQAGRVRPVEADPGAVARW
ncbi:hypothetical protein GCM10009679_59130 [Saccharothrix algeriensis]|uniref:Uncharacterized protein n=1 Tax=Catellatospora bangladeshensis TaxID=310355 RepID=A0A8J3K072_9ACTN|nr:hypothetical protein Cba03nite_75630 [Catellatospora bangladeshensis]